MKPHLICTVIAGLTALGTLCAAEKTGDEPKKAKPALEKTDGEPKKKKPVAENPEAVPEKTKGVPEKAKPEKTKVAAEGTKAAPEKKGGSISDYSFWTTAKRGAVPEFVPGLNAALQLTDTQKQQIADARNEVAADENVKAARGISKSDPNVTPEQREKARAAVAAAHAKLQEKVAAILTPEQKTLIEKINAAHAEAMEETGIIYADKFATIKADPEARRRIQQEKNEDTEEQIFHKLDKILTPAQREAMERAAEEQAKGVSATPKKVKN